MEIPREYNAATWFVDRHVTEGRGGRLAVIHEGGRLTYGDVAAGANRLGNALRRLGVQQEHDPLLPLHAQRSEEHTSELQSPDHLVCRLLLEKKNKYHTE